MTRRADLAIPIPRRLLAACALLLPLLAACGRPGLERLALGGGDGSPTPAATTTPAPTPTPLPPPESSLAVSGDMVLAATAADVALEPAPDAPGPGARLLVEVRHREGSSARPSSVLAFYNVPAQAGTYRLHAPETPSRAGRVYAYFTTRGEALGSMKDFNTMVTGTLSLSEAEGRKLVGSFQVSAQEAPPPVLPVPEGQPVKPVLGTVPTPPPARVEAVGSFRAQLPPAVLLPGQLIGG